MRADPNTETAAPSSASSPKPSTNSAWIRSTRHGSACTQSDGPRESSSRWSVVVKSTWSRRCRTGPLRLSLTMRSPPFQPGPEPGLATLDVLDRHVLLLLVRQHRVARAEVDGGDPESREAGHVGPAELRVHLA